MSGAASPQPQPAQRAQTAAEAGLNRQLLRITALLQLEQRARRAATAEELGFVIANETHALVPYRQAALWRPGPAGDTVGARVAAVSGVAVPDADGPYVAWLKRLFAHLWPQGGDPAPRPLTPASLPPDLAGAWEEWLPAHALLVPLPGPKGRRAGLLLLARPEPFGEPDAVVFDYLGEAYGHALAAQGQDTLLKRGLPKGWKPWAAGTAAALLLLLAVPVRQSALAPAEVVARTPTLVRAPIEGVIDRVVVEPNAAVKAGDLLLVLDQAKLRSQLDIARKGREVAEAEYRSAAQLAVFDGQVKASLAALQGKLEQAQAEVAYLESQVSRAEVRAPHDGLAVFDDRNDWEGRPVAVGERIMLLADPADLRLDVHLPVGDAVTFEPGAEVKLFLNVAPDRPVPAVLESSAFRATGMPDGTLAYRLKAAIAPAEAHRLRIGLKGTAKVFAHRVPLGLYLLRRPLAVARQWLAW